MANVTPDTASHQVKHWLRMPSTKAGLLYLLPTLAVLSMWWILLYQHNPPNVTPSSTLSFVLTEGAQQLWFHWLIALPVLCLALSAGYFSSVAKSRQGAVVLLIIGTALAIAAWFSVTHELALFVSLPLLYGVVHARGT